jgi:hypothetical protein
MRFLETAGRMYKFRAQDRLLIHAQRPDATACAGYDIWNTKLGRRVNRGAKGIVLASEDGASRLDYVFDISDTAPQSAAAPPPYIWAMRSEGQKGAVSAQFGALYGEAAATESVGKGCRYFLSPNCKKNPNYTVKLRVLSVVA